MRESRIERYLVKKVESCGGLCLKFVSPGMNGVPDRIVLLQDGQVTFVETKAPNGKPSPAQLRRHKELLRRGHVVQVINSIERVDELFF